MRVGGCDVGAIGLGTAPLAFKDITIAQAVDTVHAAIDAGVRLIDTALAYTRPGVESFAETVVATALRDRDAHVLVATKGGHRRDGQEFPIDASPAALRADCELSLRSLQVETIDLYQLHHVDPKVPFIESVGALAELQAAGKIRMIGLSNVDVEHIKSACIVTDIASVQNRFSLTFAHDRPTAQHCHANRIAYLAYMPLGGSADRSVDPALTALARRHRASVQQVQLAWVLAQGAHIMPLVGSSRPSTIRDSVAAADLRHDVDEIRALGEML